MINKYTALLAKLKEATGPFPEMESSGLAERMYPGDGEDEMYWLLYLALQSGHQAIGAALELVEMGLPGCIWALGSGGRSRKVPPPWFSMTAPTYHETSAPTLPLAILMAWCQAMITKEQS